MAVLLMGETSEDQAKGALVELGREGRQAQVPTAGLCPPPSQHQLLGTT